MERVSLPFIAFGKAFVAELGFYIAWLETVPLFTIILH